MQGQFFVPDRKITDDCLLREPIGTKILHPFGADIAFVQIHVEHRSIDDVFFTLAGVQGLFLHLDQFKEVQHALGKKDAEEVLVELQL